MDEASVNNKKNEKGFIKKAFSYSVGTLASRLLGLFRDLAMAALFDRTITDAWAAAFRLPNFFRRLFGEGSLSAAFIPEWQKKRHESSEVAQDFVNQSFSLIALLLAGLSLILIVGANPIMKLLLSDLFVADSLRFELTVKMVQIMGGFVFCVGVSGLLSAMLQIHGEFGWTGLAPIFFNIGMIAFTFAPVAWFSRPGYGLAWGVFVGGLSQTAVLYWRFRNRGLKWWRTSINLKQMWSFLIKIPAGFLAIGLLQILFLVNSFLVSGLDTGTMSRLYWADRLLELPLSLIAVSLGTALLPELSRLFMDNKRSEFAGYVEQNLLYGAFILLPAAGGLWALSTSLIDLLFLRGEFSNVDLEVTAGILKFSAAMLVFQSLYRILLPVFLAQSKNKWIFRSLVISLTFHLALAPLVLHRWQLLGILWLTVVTLAIAAGILLLVYLSEFGWGAHESAGSELIKILISAAVMTSFLSLLETRFIDSGTLAQVGAIFFGIGIYAVFLVWLRSRTLRLGWKHLKQLNK